MQSEHRSIPLGNGGEALVDLQDFELANQYRWHRNTNGYARTSVWVAGRARTLYLHRLLMNTPPGMDTDHINGDRLDNRRANLRICTRSQNLANQFAIRGLSPYRGVTFHPQTGKWRAEIKFGGKRISIGVFVTELEAAKAYNIKATELYGALAHLNAV